MADNDNDNGNGNGNGGAQLEKNLGLLDVYAICTGAMFASGFFLLPGIAAANAGPSVILAYFASSLLMIPALFSIGELSSAMPRAAGTYFFIHRSMGPLAGTVGGLGAWLVLVAKSAFALVGMGAYLALFFDVPVQPLAVALTVAFGLLNVFGAKETAKLQVWLVVTLVSIMTFFIAAGVVDLVAGDAGAGGAGGDADEGIAERFTPFFEAGFGGMISTIGLVFISYAGLTKVSSSAEEIKDLDRNLPLGMILALATVGAIYTAGVALLVAVIPADELRGDLTPVATGAEIVLDWLPGQIGVGLIVVAAVAAFASTGNAGILTASRYPLAMARDRLLWSGFDRLGRFGTPTVAIVVTCALMVVLILFLDVERLASLGSAFLLLLFALLNVSVILMRESRLSSYAPGYHSPLYPWMQIVGTLTTLGLIVTLGPLYLVFIAAILVLSYVWYRSYVRSRVEDRAALYGWFLRIGRKHDEGVDAELFGILQERGAEAQDSFDELIARAPVVELAGHGSDDDGPESGEVLDELWAALTEALREQLDQELNGLDDQLDDVAAGGVMPEGVPAAILELFRDDLEHPQVVLARVQGGVELAGARRFPGNDPTGGELDEADRVPGPTVEAVILLVGPEGRLTQHLRLLAQLVTMVEEEGFSRRWREADDEQQLRETLLRDERFASLAIGSDGPLAGLVGRRNDEAELPGDALVALVRRGDATFVPTPDTTFERGDRITVVGSPEDVSELIGRD